MVVEVVETDDKFLINFDSHREAEIRFLAEIDAYARIIEKLSDHRDFKHDLRAELIVYLEDQIKFKNMCLEAVGKLIAGKKEEEEKINEN